MMKSNKKFLLLFTAIFITVFSTAFAENPENFSLEDEKIVKITSNGEKIVFFDEPFISNNEIYIPVRDFLVSTASDIKITWNNADRSVMLDGISNIFEENKITKAYFSINSANCKIYRGDISKEISLENCPILKNSKTFIPLELALQLEMELSMTNGFEVSISDTAPELLENSIKWANALISRDGKPRYEMMTEKMKSKFIENQKALVNSEDWNYTIGFSSPKIISYIIIADEDCADITYFSADNSGERYSNKESVIFTNTDDKWLVENVIEDTDEYCIFLKSIDGDTLIVNLAEIITSDNLDRISELNLNEKDFADNSYYIYIDEDVQEYTLTDDTIYNIYDWQNLFTEKLSPEQTPEKYTTQKRSEFEQYINSFENSIPSMPFKIEVDGNNVISITEILVP